MLRLVDIVREDLGRGHVVHQVQTRLFTVHGHRVRSDLEGPGSHILGTVGEIAREIDGDPLVVLLGEQEIERVRDDVLHVHLVPEDLPDIIAHHVARDEETVFRTAVEVRPVEGDPYRPAGTAHSLPEEPETVRTAQGGKSSRIG